MDRLLYNYTYNYFGGRVLRGNINIKAFPARGGESILVRFDGIDKTNILIDCGYKSTYRLIKQELIKIKERGEKLDLLILTHIDNDHIGGARSILQDYINDDLCEISEIWINDYFRICDLKTDENRESNLEELLLLRKIVKQKYPIDSQNYGEKNAGYKEASILEEYLSNIKIEKKVNSKFGGEAIYIEDKNSINSVFINEDVEIKLIGPRKSVLIDLIDEWTNYLIEKGFDKEITKSKELARAFELFYINSMDKDLEITSKENNCTTDIGSLEELISFDEFKVENINRSSISFILKFYDKELLFLGDASSKDYDEVLECISEQNGGKKIDFELIKVSHHGSKFDTSPRMLKYARSKRYLILTNGNGYNHPDLEVIAKIICSQVEKKEIIFNYRHNKVFKLIGDHGLDKLDNFSITHENIQKLGMNILNIDI